MVLDPLHYLATLGRKPGALDHAPVFRDWKLPACFAAFRAALERAARRDGRRAAVRAGLATARRAPAGACPRRDRGLSRESDLISAEAVIRRAQVLAAIEAPAADRGDSLPARPRRPRSTSRSPT